MIICWPSWSDLFLFQFSDDGSLPEIDFNASILFWFKDSFSKNGGTSLAGEGSIKSGQGVPNPGSKSNSSNNSGGGANKSRPKYLECWGDADKPFAWSNITENNATAKSTAMMVMKNNVYVKIYFDVRLFASLYFRHFPWLSPTSCQKGNSIRATRWRIFIMNVCDVVLPLPTRNRRMKLMTNTPWFFFLD